MPAVVPVAVQLYSLRDAVAADGLAAVLERVAGIGFDGVETAGLADLTSTALTTTLSALGLRLAAAHIPLPQPDAAGALLDSQQAAGADTVVVAYLPPEAFADADAVARSAERLNALHRQATARGMALAYHNHHWEFSIRIGGSSAHQRLFERLVPEVLAEIDTYWARVGGADPAAELERLGGRAALLHLKDGPADDPGAAMTALGRGRMNLEAILAASRARWHVVELDRCDGDMWHAIEASFHYLNRQQHGVRT